MDDQVKHIYFVRHGESESNASGVRQGEASDLSEKGKEQANFVAERFTRIPIELVISSPFPRAQQTAEAISKRRGIPCETSEFPKERIYPKIAIGKPIDDPEVIQAVAAMEKAWIEQRGSYGGSESFDDVLNRARKLTKLLLSKSEQHIVVVTHGAFMRFFLGYVSFGEAFKPEEFFRMMKAYAVKNTGITYFKNTEGKWQIVTWNDHAHLG